MATRPPSRRRGQWKARLVRVGVGIGVEVRGGVGGVVRGQGLEWKARHRTQWLIRHMVVAIALGRPVEPDLREG